MMVPQRTSDHGIVMEFKSRDSQKEKSLEITCKNALKQINEKQYITKLLNRNMDASNIYVYGLAFEGKKVLVCGGANDIIDWDKILKPNKSKNVKKK